MWRLAVRDIGFGKLADASVQGQRGWRQRAACDRIRREEQEIDGDARAKGECSCSTLCGPIHPDWKTPTPPAQASYKRPTHSARIQLINSYSI